MAIVSGSLICCPGLAHACYPKLLFDIGRPNEIRFGYCSAIWLGSRRIPGEKIQYITVEQSRKNHVLAGMNHHQLSYEDDLPEESLWLSLIKETIWGLKSLVEFLIEQPSQLKYIEWPSFQSTLKTATLSLVLVTLFIVVLSSVDSGLCYLLALFLRRTP